VLQCYSVWLGFRQQRRCVWCVAVRCKVLQGDAVLRCVVSVQTAVMMRLVFCRVLLGVAGCCSATVCGVLQRVAIERAEAGMDSDG